MLLLGSINDLSLNVDTSWINCNIEKNLGLFTKTLCVAIARNMYVFNRKQQKGIYWWHLVKCILQLLNKPEVVFIHSKSHSFSNRVSWNQTMGNCSFFHFLNYQIDCFRGFVEFHSFHVTLPMYNKQCLSILELFWMR